AKYSQEFKLEVVQYYLSGFGRHQVSHKFGIHHSDVAKWVANYNNHGAEGLSRKNTNTVYTPEFKFKVIQSVLEQGLSVREATNQFNLKSHTQL
ncbi:TPA: transposase, partial [Acinetobacter baumannii]|nr:transposase [Acinetobacter baumannii]